VAPVNHGPGPKSGLQEEDMIKDRAEMIEAIEIDLTGPAGNAFVLLGYVNSLGKQLGWSPEDIAAVKSDMRSGDYEHLVNVFDKHFGRIVTLYR